MKANLIQEIPELTAKVVKAAFPKGNKVVTIRDELGVIFADADFAELYAKRGQPGVSPSQLAMVTLLQYMEDLPDRQAAEAVRSRIDWKYALGLELTDAGFDYSVLSEFRQRLVDGEVEHLLFEKLLEACADKELLGGKKKQRTDSTHVLGAIRQMSLLELVGEAMRRVLNQLAQVAPTWLEPLVESEWTKRYGRRFDGYRLPKSKEKREELARQIGQDGHKILSAASLTDAPDAVQSLPLMDVLRRIWVQQFYCDGQQVHWRTKKQWGQPKAGDMLASTTDLDARYSAKRQMEWQGYKVHLTETCDPEHPRLITQVTTTVATVHDCKATNVIQQSLDNGDLLPEEHLVDMGYVEADLLVSSQKRGVDLVAPVPSDKSWQERQPDAYDHTQFDIDWESQVATCPNGKQSITYSERTTRRGSLNVMFKFAPSDCQACPVRSLCTRAKTVGRGLTVYPQAEYEALVAARERQKTEAFKQCYSARAGIEGTISQAVRKFDVRHNRYLGLAKTYLQHLATAAALNLTRIADWLDGVRPKTTTIPPFVALANSLQ